MKHFGDITKIHGGQVPIVDIITGGSPCQDLSVAGARAGLNGERSGLFMDQIRIVKEMRDASRRSIQGTDEYIRPRYMVWENVLGAFSSNKGEDFRVVLEETARVIKSDAVIPRPAGGKWAHSGCILGDGWSIAWRVHDAQFWGVPQRRKRIALVADFGGTTAPKILFESQGLSRDIKESGEEREGSSGTSEPNFDEAICLQGNGIDRDVKQHGSGWRRGQSYTLNTIDRPAVLDTISFQERAGCDGGVKESSSNESESEPSRPSTIRAYLIGNGQANDAATCNEEVSKTLNCNDDIGKVMIAIEGNGSRDSHHGDGFKESETMFTLNTVEKHSVCYGLDRASFNQGENAKYDFAVEEEKAQPIVARGPGGGTDGTVGSLCARDYKGVGNQYVDEGKVIIQRSSRYYPEDR